MSKNIHCDVEGCTETAPLVSVHGLVKLHDMPTGWSEVATVEDRIPAWAKKAMEARNARAHIPPGALLQGFPTIVRRHVCSKHNALAFKPNTGTDDGGGFAMLRSVQENIGEDIGE